MYFEIADENINVFAIKTISCGGILLKKVKNILCISFLSISMFILLVSCSSDNIDSDNERLQTELESMQAELDNLQSALAEMNSESNAPQSATDSLQTEDIQLEAATTQRETGSMRSEATQTETGSMRSEATQIDPTVTKVKLTGPTLEEELLGEWFFESDFTHWLVSFTFSADGSASEIHTEYRPPGTQAFFSDNHPGSFDEVIPFSWRLDGNIFCFETTNGDVHFVFVNDRGERKLRQVMPDGSDPPDGSVGAVLTRINPVPDGYVTLASIHAQQQSVEAFITRRFLGRWHWDLVTWTFNDDGTAVIDVPALYGNPPTQIEFTYRVAESTVGKDAFLSIILDDGTIQLYHATFDRGNGGSVTLYDHDNESIMLTRNFDMLNMPITEVMMRNVYNGVFGGGLISQLLLP